MEKTGQQVGNKHKKSMCIQEAEFEKQTWVQLRNGKIPEKG